ncbi:unnamed protein product [Mycena citricolor]|uniref:Uncharacterized protein n=1 Tax=Mycena citricolor TaxID=2018698 RepID=A0AAD2Q1N3_9AGAR|nr:unnamed protein product [Mycena citricolor]
MIFDQHQHAVARRGPGHDAEQPPGGGRSPPAWDRPSNAGAASPCVVPAHRSRHIRNPAGLRVEHQTTCDADHRTASNYDAGGFTPRFTAIEYVLGVFTEWLACVLLNVTYYTSKNDPLKPNMDGEREREWIGLKAGSA